MQNSLNSFFKTLAIVVGLALGWYITYLVTPTPRIHYSLYSSLYTPYKTTQTNLESKELDTLPPAFAKLLNLHTLILRKNKLSTFPSVVFKLPELENLDLSYNTINKLPSKFRFSVIKKLDLSWNNIEELPSSIKTLSKLRELNLSGNILCGLPPSIVELHRTLRVLDLSYNPIDSATLKSIQQKLPNTKIIFEQAPALSMDYKSFATQKTKENIFGNFYSNYKPSSFHKTRSWRDRMQLFKKMYQCTKITVQSSAIHDYPPHLFKRLHHVQEIYLKGFVREQEIQYAINVFPNLKGIILDHNFNTSDLAKYIEQTGLSWVGLGLRIYKNGELATPIPQEFYDLPKTKLIHLLHFESYSNQVFPKIKEGVDGVVLYKYRSSMPNKIENLPKNLKAFFLEYNSRSCQDLNYFKELELLVFNSKIEFISELDFLSDMKELKELYLGYTPKGVDYRLPPYLQNLEHLELLSIKSHQGKKLDSKAFQAALPNLKIIGL